VTGERAYTEPGSQVATFQSQRLFLLHTFVCTSLVVSAGAGKAPVAATLSGCAGRLGRGKRAADAQSVLQLILQHVGQLGTYRQAPSAKRDGHSSTRRQECFWLAAGTADGMVWLVGWLVQAGAGQPRQHGLCRGGVCCVVGWRFPCGLAGVPRVQQAVCVTVGAQCMAGAKTYVAGSMCCRVCGCSNPHAHATDGAGLHPALATRFGHLKVAFARTPVHVQQVCSRCASRVLVHACVRLVCLR
jgi:hypothetical protein